MALVIFDIDIDVKNVDIEDVVKDYIDRHNSQYNTAINAEVINKRAKIAGDVVEINFTPSTAPTMKASIYAKKERNGTHFTPLTFKSFGGKFYKCSSDDTFTAQTSGGAMLIFLGEMAEKYSGTFVAATVNNRYTRVNGEISSIEAAMFDPDTKIMYAEKSNKNEYIDANGEEVWDTQVNLFEWVKKQNSLTPLLSSCSDQRQKIDIIGKYLIRMKMRNMIDTMTFLGLFRQAGSIGFSDKETDLKQIHSLIL